MADNAKLPKGYLAVTAFGLVCNLWVYGGEVTDTLALRSSEVAALSEAPNLTLAALVLAATFGAAAATLYGVVRRKTAAWRGYTAMPILLVVLLLGNLVFLSSSHSYVGSTELTLHRLNELANQANLLATPTQVPRARELESLVPSMDAPPFLVRGERPKAWRLIERDGCSGPADDAKGEPVGTIVYCRASDGQQAWISVVALSLDHRFGPAAMMSRNGKVVAWQVTTHPDPGPEDDSDAPSSEPLILLPDAG